MKRRNFLKITGGGAVAGAATPLVAEARENLEVPAEAVGMLYDATLCIGCKACMVQCKKVNGMPPEISAEGENWDSAKDLSGKTLNVIKAYRHGTAEVKDRATDGFSFVKRHCMHCVDPGCISVCPVTAMRKNEKTGVVTHHADVCIGCRYCVYACPYNVPKYDFEGAFGQINKCQFCNQTGVERLDKGQLPGCVEVCPTGASLFGTRKELLAEAKKRLALKPGEEYDYPRGTIHMNNPHRKAVPEYQQRVYGEKHGGGTQIMHMAGVPFEKLGLPNLPERSFASMSDGVQHALYNMLMLPAAVLAGLIFVVRKNMGADENQDQSS